MKSIAVSLILATALAIGFAAAPARAADGCRPADALARRLLDGTADAAELPVAAEIAIGEDVGDDGRLVVTVRVELARDALARLRGDGDWAPLCLGVVAEGDETLRTVHQRVFEAVDLERAERFVFAVELVLPAETEQLLAIVELPRRAVWGGAAAEDGDRSIEPGPGAVRLDGLQRAWYEVAGPAPARTPSSLGQAVVRLVPPRDQPVSGNHRIYALTSSEVVDRVDFYLDDRKVGADRRRPYNTVLPLARPARPQRVRVVAHDRGGTVLGEHELVINQLDAPFRVRITELTPDPRAGMVTVAARADIPLDAELESLALYRGETLIERFAGPELRTRVETPSISPEDYLRVAAVLTDGREIDDVVLLASPGLSEQLEVNLVALYAVVSDPAGTPIPNLRADDFGIRLHGEPRPIETFSYADDVPLVLGLVIDTSGSMAMIEGDVRRAAARFLQDTMQGGDRGFLVDFKERPRLLQGITGDVVELLSMLGRLQAEGRTSLYDAIIFSMLEIEPPSGRKALVVLTDGADVESRFGPKDCVDYGQRLGVPIYILALDNQLGGKIPRRELERVAEQTGGRLYRVADVTELGPAYARINAELRSQYGLGFYVAEDLSPQDRRKLEVVVRRPGATVRAVVGAGTSP